MRNSVILVDQIQQDTAAGHDAFTAIVESAVRRFRHHAHGRGGRAGSHSARQ
jgi:Cu/Ag efflux pump CusA